MVKKNIFYILFMCVSFFANAQVYQGPKVDSLKLLMDINGGNVAWATISASAVQWGDGFGANNMAFIASLRASVTLPVTLSSFAAKKEANLVNIKWSTVSEIKFSHFEVLKSTDGKVFNSIGYISAKGNSDAKNDYSFKDQYPNQGVNYYQLKMVDADGTSKESFIISVQFDLNNTDVLIVSNNEEGLVKFEVYTQKSGSFKVDILDVQGKKIAAKDIRVEKGNNSFDIAVKVAPQILIGVIDFGTEKITRKFFY